VEIVAYQPEHSAELLSFLRAQFPASPLKGDPSFFRWRFARNPLGSSLDNYHLAMENNRIVGQLGAIRDRIWARDRWLDCCWLVDLILAPEHRGARSTAALRLFQVAMKKCPLLLVTGAGPKLFRFYKALRWDYREVSGTYFAIRRPGPLLALARDAGETRPALEPFLPLAGLAMTALQSAWGRWREWPGVEFEFDRLDRFGDESDDLIERVLPSLPATSHRSPPYLNWKFNQRPEGTHFAIAARRKGRSRIEGYMAVKIMERRPHARWAEIVDFLTDPGDPTVFAGLLGQVTRQALEADVDFLRLRCSLKEHRNLLKSPFWIHHNRPVIDGTFFRTEDAELSRYLAEAPWHLTSLVSDRTDHGADEFAARRRSELAARAVASI
jgi:hypothetical protein